MEKNSVEAIVGALNEAGVRYLIVGGMAVVAHGYLRFTADLDLMGRKIWRTSPGCWRCGRAEAVLENQADRDREWERGWAGHELAQLRRLARLPLSQKLAWLEEAHRLVLQLRGQTSLSPGTIPNGDNQAMQAD